MNFPSELKYTKTHEWAKREGDRVTIGITEFAQKEISDIVFIELPKTGQSAEKAKPVAVVESVKAAFDIYAPVGGKVLRSNQELDSNPGMVNQDPYGQGWFCEIEMSDSTGWDELMTSDQYEKMLKQEAK